MRLLVLRLNPLVVKRVYGVTNQLLLPLCATLKKRHHLLNFFLRIFFSFALSQKLISNKCVLKFWALRISRLCLKRRWVFFVLIERGMRVKICFGIPQSKLQQKHHRDQLELLLLGLVFKYCL